MTVALDLAPADTHTDAPGLLTSAYRRLVSLCEALEVRVTEPRRMHVVGDCLTESQDAVEAFVAAEAARIRENHGHTAPRHVAASRALHDYAWSVGLLMSGVWYLGRRVPRIVPEDIRVDLASGAFVLTPGSHLTCLPDDPATALPGVRTVVREEDLRAELRDAVADHMRPVLAAIGPYTRRGSRALWGLVADDLVSGIWHLGRVLGEEAAAVRAASDVLPSPVAPYPGGAGFRTLRTADGQEHPTRTRLGCCMYYTIRPDDACSTCPRTCDAERLRRLGG
ncbi:(2Fe-2S)-binding protein [Streptomyces phyllanthi]|uniref:(2Fe-2S)-binding protein n=1 Tax=Streptomyces phyllanthi TaxID=1803180 RepID=A0A5N8W3B9_9ACTN|nr:(2Fe-2S)-binding protein [Streptomyces phyllanthi]MPY40645.1 (2Fe-2S)-binding protein [Streptomyces phyllanthi]